MKTSKKQTGTKLRKTKGKRVSLRCPLSIDRTELEYNFDESAVQVCITVENMGGGGLSSDTIESIVVVVRLFEKDGKIVPCGTNDYFAKPLKFGDEGLESGERITFRLIPDCGAAGIRAEDAEIYISRIRYTDNTVTDYVRGDFFDFPGDGVLLTKKFKKNIAEAVGRLGNGAKYLPEHLTEIVWRCTCGEFSEADNCPTCGRNKAELFAVLDELTAPKNRKPVVIVPMADTPIPAGDHTADQSLTDDNTAEYSIQSTLTAASSVGSNADGEPSEESADPENEMEPPNVAPPVIAPQTDLNEEGPDKLKTVLLVAISAASVVLLVIILLLVLTLCGKKQPAESTTTTTEPPVTESAPTDYSESIVRTYLSQNDFKNALGYAMQAGCKQTLIDEIYTAAIDYYTAAGDLNQALEWVNLKGDQAMAESIYLLLFTQKLSDGDYMGAMAMVEKLPAGQQASAKAQAGEGFVQSLLAEGKYEEAMEAANQYQTATTAQKIAETAIGNYLAAKEFDTAIEMAQKMELPAQVVTAAAAATDYYKSINDYDRAADYVVLTGSTTRMQEILGGMTDSQIRRHLPAFFPLLSAQQMQAVHSAPMSTKPQAIAAIDAEGNVFLGDVMIYSQEETGIPAISVSCCDTAVVILLSNGTVQIAEGSNSSYSAEDIALWSDVVAIAAGNYHLLALTKDGKVLATGKNDDGQCSTESITDAVAIAVGDNHSLILLSDGSVKALGNNVAGICNTDKWSDIIAIAAGTMHSIGLKADGTVVALGNCDVDGWKDVTAIFSYATTAVALKSDGTLFCSISGKPSETVSAVSNVLWVGVGKQAVVILYKDGTLAVPGKSIPDASLLAGIPLKTDVFGIAE
ncbi:MAG: hypothetical protein IJW98_02040 [Clostridia bacterium]|nr:hypothetical protein [Clostridia bacterium]